MKKLSIGIPTYNQGDYLEDTILSILNQTEKPYEIIVSNNHSTDNTSIILNKYSDFIKIITPPEHLTMVENWNYLLNHVSGDWVSLISSDDLYEPNFVEIFNKNVRDDTVLMRFGYNLIDGEGRIIAKNKRIRTARKIQAFPGNFLEELSSPKNSFAAFAINMDAFKKIDFFDNRIVLNSDWATWCKLAPLGKYQYVPETISNYRTYNRPNLKYERLLQESNDQSIIVNEIQEDIIKKYNLKPFYRNKVKALVASRRYFAHKELGYETDIVLKLYSVTEKDILKLNALDKFIIKINEAFFKI